MVSMKRHIYTLSSMVVFLSLGILSAYGSKSGAIVFGDIALTPATSWALTGLLFVMAFCSLEHLSHKKK
jgi:ABC-type enterochelin transport system substrate-binding protein